jgi:hypothetical protein|tara:strand:+ start:1145 stop:1675 length:531 start_codon:yes stop_codon:yes gene_type:complete
MLVSAVIEANEEPGVTDRRSRAKWLKRIMSKIMRQKVGFSTFSGCEKRALADVPDHSNAPASREIPNVISDATVLTLIALRNSMKFAGACQLRVERGDVSGRPTVRSGIQDDEARIDWSASAIVTPRHGVCMTAETMLFLDEVDLVVRVAEGPQSAEAGNAAADDGYALLLHAVGG